MYLRHITECLDAIRTYAAAGRDAFFYDRKTQKATLRELQELAESTRRISEALKTAHPEVPWKDIAGFRNVLVHDYLGLELTRIWHVVEADLPRFRAAIEAIVAGLPAE